MAHIRILHNNAVKQSVATASTVAASYPATNLLTDLKSYVWRSTSTAEQTLSFVLEKAHAINCVVLAFTNLSVAGKVKIKLYTQADDVAPVFDSGWRYPFTEYLENSEWGVDPLGENVFVNEGSSTGAIWLSQATLAKKMEVVIQDAAPLDNFFEIGCVAAGAYWSPERGCEFGCQMVFIDNTEQGRSDAGDLRVDRGCTYRKLSVDVSNMTSVDKTRMWKTVSKVGKHSPLFVSVIPEADNPSDEQLYQVYGKLTTDASIVFKFLDMFDTNLEIEEL